MSFQDDIIQKSKAKLMFKLLNDMGPKSLADLFYFKNELTDYELRGVESALCLPQPRSNSMKKSLIFDGAHVWNSLPNKLRESNSLKAFENNIATNIFE